MGRARLLHGAPRNPRFWSEPAMSSCIVVNVPRFTDKIGAPCPLGGRGKVRCCRTSFRFCRGSNGSWRGFHFRGGALSGQNERMPWPKPLPSVGNGSCADRMLRAKRCQRVSVSARWPSDGAARAVCRTASACCGQEKSKDVLLAVGRSIGLADFCKVEDPCRTSTSSGGQPVHGKRLADNMQSPVPEQVCFRLDFPRWARGAYSDRDQRIIDEDMMIGEHTAARRPDKYGMTASRVSQKRPRVPPQQGVATIHGRSCRQPRTDDTPLGDAGGIVRHRPRPFRLASSLPPNLYPCPKALPSAHPFASLSPGLLTYHHLPAAAALSSIPPAAPRQIERIDYPP